MKIAQKITIVVSCLLAEVLSAYIFVKYAVMSDSKLWMGCAIMFISSAVTQMMVITDGRAN